MVFSSFAAAVAEEGWGWPGAVAAAVAEVAAHTQPARTPVAVATAVAAAEGSILPESMAAAGAGCLGTADTSSVVAEAAYHVAVAGADYAVAGVAYHAAAEEWASASGAAVGVAVPVHKLREGRAKPYHHTCPVLGSEHHNRVDHSTDEASVVAEGAFAEAASVGAAFAVAEASAAGVSLPAAHMPAGRPRPLNPGRHVRSHPTQYQMEMDL